MTTTFNGIVPRPRAPTPLQWSVRWLAALSALALASTKECEPIFLFVFVSFFFIGVKIQNQVSLTSFFEKTQPVLAALILAVAIVDFLYLSNSFLLTVAHFLLCLQALQLLVLRTIRENLGGILLSSLMILSASTLAVEWTFFALFAIFLPVLIWTLILHTLFGDAREVEQSMRRPGMTLPGAQVFFQEKTWIPAKRHAGMTGPFNEFASGIENSPWWQNLKPALRNASLAGFVIAILCCAFVFVIFPRFNFRGFRGQFLQPVHKTGFTNQVNLDKEGKIFEDNSIVMRIEIPKADREKWPGYVRGGALEIFDGKVWKRAPYTPERLYPATRGEFRLGRRTSFGDVLHQSIYLESMDSPILFAAEHPSLIKIDRPMLETFPDGSVQRLMGDAWRLHYEVDSVLSRSRENSLSPPSSSALQLPMIPLGKLQNQALALVKEISDPLLRAQQLSRFLSETCEYSLSPPTSKSGSNPVEAFVFENKKGHCEYFASALCLMLRYAGVSARIVTGFYSDEWNERGGYFLVRMRNAHAWVEAYIPSQGWVSLDPSPRMADEKQAIPEIVKKWQETWDFLNLRWNRYILSYDFEKQKSMVESVTERSSRVSVAVGGVGNRFVSWLKSFKVRLTFSKKGESTTEGRKIPWLAFLMMGLSGAGLVAVMAHNLRERRARKTDWLYKKLIRFLEKRGGPKPEAVTLREFLEKVRPDLKASAEEAQFLQREYYRFRYGPPVTISPQEKQIFSSIFRRLS